MKAIKIYIEQLIRRTDGRLFGQFTCAHQALKRVHKEPLLWLERTEASANCVHLIASYSCTVIIHGSGTAPVQVQNLKQEV